MLAAVPETRAPLPVMQEQGIPAAAAEAQVSPVVQVEQATRVWPSVPTVRVVGVLAAVPVTRAPLAVMQPQGIPAAPADVQVNPVVQAAHAVRI